METIHSDYDDKQEVQCVCTAKNSTGIIAFLAISVISAVIYILLTGLWKTICGTGSMEVFLEENSPQIYVNLCCHRPRTGVIFCHWTLGCPPHPGVQCFNSLRAQPSPPFPPVE